MKTNEKTRLVYTDTTMSILLKMSDGNPKAVTVLAQLMTGIFHEVPGFMLILNLDSMGVYGSHIWRLYKDCCKQDINEMEKVLRAWQLGKITGAEVHLHIEQGKEFDLPSVDEMLEELDLI